MLKSLIIVLLLFRLIAEFNLHHTSIYAGDQYIQSKLSKLFLFWYFEQNRNHEYAGGGGGGEQPLQAT